MRWTFWWHRRCWRWCGGSVHAFMIIVAPPRRHAAVADADAAVAIIIVIWAPHVSSIPIPMAACYVGARVPYHAAVFLTVDFLSVAYFATDCAGWEKEKKCKCQDNDVASSFNGWSNVHTVFMLALVKFCQSCIYTKCTQGLYSVRPIQIMMNLFIIVCILDILYILYLHAFVFVFIAWTMHGERACTEKKHGNSKSTGDSCFHRDVWGNHTEMSSNVVLSVLYEYSTEVDSTTRTSRST